VIISVINHAQSDISAEEAQVGVRALNRQLAEDFERAHSIGARLRLEGPSTQTPTVQTVPDLRGDAILYLWDGQDVEDALGYHDRNARGIPYGFVFTKLARQLGEPWTVTASHEALEMALDPQCNLLVQGPHPGAPDQEVLHWYEVCDAVQSQTYVIDGVRVSNFLLPLYFTTAAEPGGRNDFLGRGPLASFGIAPGGYIGFFNPKTGAHETATLAQDTQARERLRVKEGYARRGRRGGRYRMLKARPPGTRPVVPVDILNAVPLQAP
jgi:hypothetical protein